LVLHGSRAVFGRSWRIAPALRATTILLRVAAPLAAISGIAWLAFILINSTDDIGSVINPEDLRLYFFETPFGTVSMVRITLLVAAVVVAFLPWTNRSWFSALLHISAVLLISQPGSVMPPKGALGFMGTSWSLSIASM